MVLSDYIVAFTRTLEALYIVRKPQTSAELHTLVADVTHILETIDNQRQASEVKPDAETCSE